MSTADPSASKRVLVLDDDPSVARMILIVARGCGFQARAAESPAEFFSWVETWRPTHIVVDLVMPDMDGLEVLRELRELGCTASIILTSGMGEKMLDVSRHAAIGKGMAVTAVLPKPFKLAQLRESLSKRSPRKASISNGTSATSFALDELDNALEKHQFIVYYQPKISLEKGCPRGVEALVRWLHPVHGLLSPDRFLRLAEETGRIREITRAVVDHSLAWLSTVRQDLDIGLELNLSGATTPDESFLDDLVKGCKKYGIPPEAITLEITETSRILDLNNARDVLARMRIKGFELAMDDFGMGYSSMSQLTLLPFTELKIDKCFVQGIETSDEQKAIVEATVGLARQLRMKTVAEGVETETSMALLRDMQCDLAQGYFVAPPMSGGPAQAWLRDHATGRSP